MQLVQNNIFSLMLSVCSAGAGVREHNVPSISIPVVDEEWMRPSRWLGSVLCVSFSAMTVLDG